MVNFRSQPIRPTGGLDQFAFARLSSSGEFKYILGHCVDPAHCGCLSQDDAGTKHGFKAIGDRKFGNTIDGCQAEYVRVPDAMANLAPVRDDLTDEQVLMCPDIMSTGFCGAESGKIRIGDTVAVFAQGPIGLCATAGARLSGATTIIAVDALPASSEPIIAYFPESRSRRRNHAPDRWLRRGCDHRGAGNAGNR